MKQELRRDEGVRSKPYRDTVGKTTIGVGRNLDDVGLSPDEIDLLLEHDIDSAEQLLDSGALWWRQLDEVRQRVLLNMAFNMGPKLFTFRNTLAAVQAGDWNLAAAGMRSSLWAKQVGPRAERLIFMMQNGRLP